MLEKVFTFLINAGEALLLSPSSCLNMDMTPRAAALFDYEAMSTKVKPSQSQRNVAVLASSATEPKRALMSLQTYYVKQINLCLLKLLIPELSLIPS